MVFDASLLRTQQYKVGIKGKVEQFRETSCALLYTSSTHFADIIFKQAWANSFSLIAQSAGAVEYTDCNSAVG